MMHTTTKELKDDIEWNLNFSRQNGFTVEKILIPLRFEALYKELTKEFDTPMIYKGYPVDICDTPCCDVTFKDGDIEVVFDVGD